MQNKIYNTRALVESSIMAAILVVTMLISVYIPFISIVAYLVLPTPVALVYVRNGIKYAIASLICGSLIGLFIMGPLNALQLIIVAFFSGLTLGYCIRNNKKASRTFMYSSIAFMIIMIINLFLITLFVYPNGFIGFIDSLIKTVNESVNITKNMYLNMGMNKEEIEKVFSTIHLLDRNQIFFILPGILIITSLILAFLNYKITSSIFLRLKVKIDKLKGITSFYIPTLIGAAMIILLCIGLIFKSRNMIIGNYISTSTLVLIEIILMINGIAALIYFLRHKLNFSNVFIVFTIILLLLAFKNIYIIIGLAELIVDSRKLDPNRIRKIR